MKCLKSVACTVLISACLTAMPLSAEDALILQSTTSTAHSGLYDHLLPRFAARSAIQVHVVAVGTGQAIRNAENCDGDVLLVHATEAEEAFVNAGFGVSRTDLMYNDFIIVGPAADPAGITGSPDAATALASIARQGARFISRGDDSGTHSKEMALWRASGIDPSAASGHWYRETGSGMGATLNVTVGMGAYTLTDRATWISFANRAEFAILVEGDTALYNQYGLILVDETHCPRMNSDAGQTFVDWLLSNEGQRAIAGYRLQGQQLFFPNAPAPTAAGAG